MTSTLSLWCKQQTTTRYCLTWAWISGTIPENLGEYTQTITRPFTREIEKPAFGAATAILCCSPHKPYSALLGFIERDQVTSNMTTMLNSIRFLGEWPQLTTPLTQRRCIKCFNCWTAGSRASNSAGLSISNHGDIMPWDPTRPQDTWPDGWSVVPPIQLLHPLLFLQCCKDAEAGFWWLPEQAQYSGHEASLVHDHSQLTSNSVRAQSYMNKQEMLPKFDGKQYRIGYLPRSLFPSGYLYFVSSKEPRLDYLCMSCTIALSLEHRRNWRFQKYPQYLWQVNNDLQCTTRVMPDLSKITQPPPLHKCRVRSLPSSKHLQVLVAVHVPWDEHTEEFVLSIPLQ